MNVICEWTKCDVWVNKMQFCVFLMKSWTSNTAMKNQIHLNDHLHVHRMIRWKGWDFWWWLSKPLTTTTRSRALKAFWKKDDSFKNLTASRASAKQTQKRSQRLRCVREWWRSHHSLTFSVVCLATRSANCKVFEAVIFQKAFKALDHAVVVVSGSDNYHQKSNPFHHIILWISGWSLKWIWFIIAWLDVQDLVGRSSLNNYSIIIIIYLNTILALNFIVIIITTPIIKGWTICIKPNIINTTNRKRNSTNFK